MTHLEKVACFEQMLRDRGYWISNSIPPASRLLWKLGFEAPPPYFLSFTTGALVAGIPIGLIYGALMRLFIGPSDISIARAIVPIAIGAVFVGICMAAFWRTRAHSLKLPAWKDFPIREHAP